ncbi:MAG: DUF5681 domain-containing protein [Mesorhizobium sp.]
MPNSDDDELTKKAIDRMKRNATIGTGYANPPQHTRFQKGQSGNPKGRPRGYPRGLSFSDQPTLVAAHDAANKKIKIREGDITKEVTATEALLNAAVAYGIKGNARYAGLALDIIRTAEQARVHEIRERNERWQSYKVAKSAELAAIAERGEPEPLILPHPDDIVIDHKIGPSFLGPMTLEEQKKMEESVAFRRAFLLQAALDERLICEPDGTDVGNGPGSAFLFATIINRSLPPRLQMTELDLIVRMDHFACHPKRWLLKQVYDAWRRLGKKVKRGTTFPMLGAGVKQIEFITRTLLAIRDGSITVNDELSFQQYVENRYPTIG